MVVNSMLGRRFAPVAAGVMLMLIAGCSSGGSSSHRGGNGAAAAIVPAAGTAQARPDKGVQVTATGGVIERVTVQGGGHTADGALSPDHKSWRTIWTLTPGTAYTVTAVTRSAGKATTTTSRFTTARATSRIAISDVTPQSGETVGVGMPIMVTFDRTVYNRAWVERALEVRSTKPVVGAWHWVSGQQIVFRPQTYWPAHTGISLMAHMAGVRAAAGTYGTTNYARSFTVGSSHIMKVNLKTDKEKVYVEGRLAKTIPVSGGVGGSDSHGNDFRTTSGVHLAMGKFSKLWFTSPNVKKGQSGYYHELVYDDVQISNTGEYLHRSPGDYDCLGDRNCSHGCVRQTPAGATWVYDLAQRGDVVQITGSSRKLDPANGWGYWQESWTRWIAGSALGRAITTSRTATSPAAQDAPAPAQQPASPTPGHD